MTSITATTDLPASIPGESKFKVPFKRTVQVLALLSGICLIAALATWPSEDVADEDSLGFVLSLIFGPTLIVLTICFGIALKVYGREVRKIARGDYIVRWRYDRELWARYIDGEVQSSRTIPYAVGGFVLALGLITGLIFFLAEDVPNKTVALLIALGGLVLGVALYAIVKAALHRSYSRLRAADGEIYVGERGVYIPGQYIAIFCFGQSLRSVRVKEKHDPPCIQFVLDVQSRNGTVERKVRIPIPPGQDEVAEAVVDYFRR